MSQAIAQKFIAEANNNPSLLASLKQAGNNISQILAVAKQAGYKFSEADFQAAQRVSPISGSLSQSDLEHVAGGGDGSDGGHIKY